MKTCPACASRSVEIREAVYLCMGPTQHTFRGAPEEDSIEPSISIQQPIPSLFVRLLNRVLRAVVRRPA
jgi:hypothetical protein